MIYNIAKVIRDVRVALDENVTSDALADIGDIDTLANDEIIRSKIVEAVKRVHLNAPYFLLESGHNFGDAIYWGDKESGHVLLPDDFMRLVVFEMSDWERAVYETIDADEPDYNKQRSRFKGIRGTAQKPVCAIVMRPEGKALEFYSCKSENATVSRAVYLPYPEIDEDDCIFICERCYTAVIYTAASLTLMTCGETEKANALSELAQTFL